MMTNEHLTLEQLEADVWPEPDVHSHLVTTCHRLRKKPLSDFSTEDLRIMLGQSIGAKHLLPRAIEILRKNPFAEGGFYEGDLLVAVAHHLQNISQLNSEDAEHLLGVCVAAIESFDPRLNKANTSAIEQLIGRLRNQLHR